MKFATALLILAGLTAAAGKPSSRSRSRSRWRKSYYWAPARYGATRWSLAGDCGEIQLVLGDDEPKTLRCARRVENAIERDFDVSVDQSIDTDATDSSYDTSSGDEVTIYIDSDIVEDDGCPEVIHDALDDVDNELHENCEYRNGLRGYQGGWYGGNWNNRGYWNSRGGKSRSRRWSSRSSSSSSSPDSGPNDTNVDTNADTNADTNGGPSAKSSKENGNNTEE